MPTRERKTREGLKLSGETLKGLEDIAKAAGMPLGEVIRYLPVRGDQVAALVLKSAREEIERREREVMERLEAAKSAGTVERPGRGVPPGGDRPAGPATEGDAGGAER